MALAWRLGLGPRPWMVLPSAKDSHQPVGTHQAGGPGSQPPMPSMGRPRLRMWVPDGADAPLRRLWEVEG